MKFRWPLYFFSYFKIFLLRSTYASFRPSRLRDSGWRKTGCKKRNSVPRTLCSYCTSASTVHLQSYLSSSQQESTDWKQTSISSINTNRLRTFELQWKTVKQRIFWLIKTFYSIQWCNSWGMINTRYGPGSTYLEEESRSKSVPHKAEVTNTTEKKKLVWVISQKTSDVFNSL